MAEIGRRLTDTSEHVPSQDIASWDKSFLTTTVGASIINNTPKTHLKVIQLALFLVGEKMYAVEINRGRGPMVLRALYRASASRTLSLRSPPKLTGACIGISKKTLRAVRADDGRCPKLFARPLNKVTH